MAEDPPLCGKCGGAMETGFALENARPLKWFQGIPERGFWSLVKTHGRHCRAIALWRCTRCGFLECYAREPIDPSQYPE